MFIARFLFDCVCCFFFVQWWAQYLESTQEFEEARKYYAAADDALSLVRVYCYCEEINKARDLVKSSHSKAAAFHLAKYISLTA